MDRATRRYMLELAQNRAKRKLLLRGRSWGSPTAEQIGRSAAVHARAIAGVAVGKR